MIGPLSDEELAELYAPIAHGGQALWTALDRLSKALRQIDHLTEALATVTDERDQFYRQLLDRPTHDDLATAWGGGYEAHRTWQRDEDVASRRMWPRPPRPDNPYSDLIAAGDLNTRGAG